MEPSLGTPICVAIMAMGGQGGGVLADWVVALAERRGWYAQSTSVPGVAQRTGATIYYIELVPHWAESGCAAPVLALMPVPGRVDIVISAEWAETGRAIQRGLVTPDRTLLIASTHRALAVQEKAAIGHGIAEGEKILVAARLAAKRLIVADMAAIAEQAGSVISASLFGALAASDALPFAQSDYEDTIRDSRVGVETSLSAFRQAMKAIAEEQTSKATPVPAAGLETAPDQLLTYWQGKAGAVLPQSVTPIASAGCVRLCNYQDEDYAEDYLARLRTIYAVDRASGGEAQDFALTAMMALRLVPAMAYDDVMRVADLKIRPERVQRIRTEVNAAEGELMQLTEFMHPRAEEICGTLPATLGRFVENRLSLLRLVQKFATRGWRVRTDQIHWFVLLSLLAGYGRFRRQTLRHHREMASIAEWAAQVCRVAPRDYRLALEIARLRSLVKGYSDTIARGQVKFGKIRDVAEMMEGRADAADWVRRLHDSALKDEEGQALDGAIATVRSFLA